MKGIISSIAILCTSILFSQNPEYIESYKKGLYVKTLVAGKDVQLEFKPVENKNFPTLKYNPNIRGQYGVKVGYNGIAVSFLTNTNKYSQDPKKFGKTDFKSLGIDISTKKWWYRVDYSATKGFFIENIGQFLNPKKPGLPPYLVEQLSIKRFSFSGMFVANASKYSHKSWINQWEKQKRSAGSFLCQYNVFRTVTKSDTSIVPWRFGKEFSELNGLKHARIDNILVQVGYGHTFSIKEKVAFGGRFLIGPGLQSRKFINENRKSLHTTNVGVKVDLGLFIMHSGRRLNYGFLFDATTISSRVKTLNYNATFTEALLFVGIRFPDVRLMTNKSRLSKVKWLKRWAIDADL